jgi:hypothetical protein
VPSAPPGRVNLPFVLTIHNDLPDREAPTPPVYVISNLAADGTVLNPAPTDVTDVGTSAAGTPAPVHIERGRAQGCGSTLIGSTSDTIAADRSTSFHGVLGGAPTTVSPDTTLAFRVPPLIERPGGRATGFEGDRYGDPRNATDGDWIARYDGTATSTIPVTTAPAPAPTTVDPPPATPASTGAFTTAAGWTYTYTVTFDAPSTKRSPGKCVPAPPPGRVNLPFTIDIHNDATDRDSPLPAIGVATNVGLDGTILNPSPTGIDDVVGGMYDDMAVVELEGASTKGIVAGRSRTYQGTVAAVPETVPPALALVVLVATPTPGGYPSPSDDTRETSWVVRYAP